MGEVSVFSDKPIVTHTHKFIVTTEIMNGDTKVGEIRMRCESCVCEMIFPTNPRAYYGEQIAREIEADPDATTISIKLAAAIARGRHEPNQVTKDAIEEARKMK